MPQPRDYRGVKVRRDASTFGQLAQSKKLQRDLFAQGGIRNDDHHAAKLGAYDKCKHRFRLAGARGHHHGGVGIGCAPMRQHSVQGANLRSAQAALAAFGIFLGEGELSVPPLDNRLAAPLALFRRFLRRID